MKKEKYISSILLITLAILINILSNYVGLGVDLTVDKRHSLSEQTHKIIKNLFK